MREAAVITGIGIVSALGVGRKPFEENLLASTRGVSGGVLEFEGESLSLARAPVAEGNLPAFIEPRRHLNFTYMSRSGVMMCAATSLAAKDANFLPDQETLERSGIVMGTAFGGVQSMLKFNAEVRAKGPTAVNPIVFPDTVSNAPAGYAAIAFGLMGMNATLSTGFSSGLEALSVAAEQVVCGELDAAFAGGYDELCPSLCQYWRRTGELAVALENGCASVPFDSRRTGFCPGEGAVVLLVERRSSADRRGAAIYGELRGWGTFLSGVKRCGVDSRSAAMRSALEDAEAEPGDISGIFASANGSVVGDREEALALSAIFGPRSPVAALKGSIGECMAAAGPAAVAASLLALQNGSLPGIPGFVQGDPDNELQMSPDPIAMPNHPFCLVNSFGLDGIGTSLVVSTTRRL